MYALEGRGHRRDATGDRRPRVVPRRSGSVVRRPETAAVLRRVGKGIDTEIVAVDLDGRAAAGVPVKVTLTQIQWNSVRRAEGGGFYTWDTERKEVPAGEWDVTTAESPVPLHVPLAVGRLLRADARPRATATAASTTTTTGFYALGAGYTAWAALRPQPHRPGAREADLQAGRDRAPHDQVALGDRDRAAHDRARGRAHVRDVRAHLHAADRHRAGHARRTSRTSSSRSCWCKGRTGRLLGRGRERPRQAAFRLGYAELKVEDARKPLQVAVKADREEYRPAAKARVDVAVTDAAGKPAAPRSRCGPWTTACSRSRATTRPTCWARCTSRRRCRS